MILNLDRLPRVIPVGIQTESGVEAIGFDISPWLTRWPDMKISVWPTRPGESAAYIAADTEMVGNVMYWYPNTADTEKEGAGTVEVVGIGGGKRKSSGVIDTLVKRTSLDVTQETPDPFATWYEAILKAAEDVSADLDAVKAEIPGILLVRIGAGNVSSHTQQEVKDAYFKGKTGKAVLMVDPMGRVFSMTGVKSGVPIFHHTSAIRLPDDAPSANALLVYEARLNADGTFSVTSPDYSTTPNPYPIKLIGAVNATYDGSSAVTVEIPQGGGGGGGLPETAEPNSQLVTDAEGVVGWAPREEVAQADWSQDSATAPDYVRSRTHYDAKGQSWPDGAAVEEGAPSAEIHKADGTLGAVRWVKVGHAPEAESLVGHCKLSSVGMVTEENILDRSESGYLLGREYDATSTTGVTRTLRSASAVVCLKAGYVANGWPLTEPLDNLSTATIPEPGLYLPVRGDGTVYRGYELQPYTKPLEDRFIPSTVTRNSDVLPLVSSERINGLIDDKLSIFGQAVCLPVMVLGNGVGSPILENPWAAEIHAGKNYIVIYNGKTYRLTAVTMPDSPVGAVVLGNGENAGRPDLNPELPFVVSAVSNSVGAQLGSYGSVAFYDDADIHTITIYEASRKGYYYYDGDTARLVGIKELRQALIDAGNPVIILPETTVQGEDGQMFLTTALAADPEAGVTYKVTYNGTAYDCHALGYAADGMAGVMLGNSDAMGVPGGNPDAPFVILLVPGGADIGDGLMLYGIIMDMAGAAEATLSIVEDVGGPEYMTREQVVALINEMTGNNA